MESYDVTFIGGGPAGYAGAIRAAQLGKKVLLIERGDIGGTCLNRGCIPTKAIIASLKTADYAKKAANFGVTVPSVHIDFEAVQKRKEKIIQTSRAGITALLKKWKVRRIQGHARLLAPDAVEVTDPHAGKEIIHSKNMVIATGSKPAGLPMFPVDNSDILDSDTIHGLRRLPKSLLIVGGGAIGCEFAHIFNRLGVEVSIVEILPQLLPLEEEETAGIIQREFKKKKIGVYKERTVTKVSKTEEGFRAELSGGEAVIAEKILVAAGRRPDISGLGLEDLGIRAGEGGEVPVNAGMETGIQGIYAAGDVTGKYPLAYVATREGITAAENCAGAGKEVEYTAIPRVVFTDPEVGSVGVSRKEAEAQGIKTREGKFLFRALGRSHASGEITGQVKVVCEEDSGKVIGVHIAGPYASEIVHTGVLAVKNKMSADELGETFFAHPVFSEALLEASWDVRQRSIHK